MAKFRSTHRSLLLSLVIHGIAALVLLFFLLGVEEKVENLINMTFFQVKRTSPPKPRLRIVKPIAVPRPRAWQEDISYNVSPQVERSPLSRSVQAGPKPVTTVTRFTEAPVVQGTPRPLRVKPTTSSVATVVDLPAVESNVLLPTGGPIGSDRGLGLLGNTAELGGPGGGTGVGRGNDGQGSGRRGTARFARAALSMVSGVRSSGLEQALVNMAEEIALGNMAIPPLPQGEPGGRIIGRGRNIKGIVRFVRIHHPLADWWADMSSLTALVHFMNASTPVRVDMNVEGGTPKFTDASLRKSPIAFMTGHDPALIRSIRSFQQMTGILKSRLTEPERFGLRRYLLGGGLLFYDDCGLNSRDYPLMRIVKAELQQTIPEYTVTKISNDHELYNSYFPLGGPAWGVSFIWRHAPQAPIRDYLEGVFIDDRIAVVLSNRDYLCAAQTAEMHAGKVHKFIPAYRMLANAVIYALMHSPLSDHSHYVPQAEQEQKVPLTPPPMPAGVTPGTARPGR